MPHQRFTPEEKAQVSEWAATLTPAEIAQRLNRSESSIRCYMHRRRIRPKPDVYQPVTPEEAQQVIALKESGLTLRQVADETGTPWERVRHIYYRHK